ncbi:MAG: hypothetical protein ACREMF_11955 [Gemmatimonadales bacterium]
MTFTITMGQAYRDLLEDRLVRLGAVWTDHGRYTDGSTTWTVTAVFPRGTKQRDVTQGVVGAVPQRGGHRREAHTLGRFLMKRTSPVRSYVIALETFCKLARRSAELTRGEEFPTFDKNEIRSLHGELGALLDAIEQNMQAGEKQTW